MQTDGKILLGGGFFDVSGQPRNNFARLHPNGTLESTATFNPGTGTDGDVFSVAVQADGKILLGGSFGSINGTPRTDIARLANDAATQSLTIPTSTRVQWARGGASPEIEQVTFELSNNGGTNWTLLGSGTRIAGGWELTGLSLPASGSIRARGRTAGANGGSTGMVESVAVIPNDFKITSFSASVPPVGGNGLRIQTTANGGAGAANAMMELQSSENLTGWITLTTTTADGSGIATFDFVDASAGDKRFYRVRKP